MPDFAKLYEGLKGQPKAITGIAHPIIIRVTPHQEKDLRTDP